MNQSASDAGNQPGGATEPIINITGEQVCLGPVLREHIPLWTRWDNDFEVMALGSFAIGPRTVESAEAKYERDTKEDGRTVRFTIYERGTLRPIGYVSLRNITHL